MLDVPYFFCLCQDERRPLYESLLKDTPYEFRFTISVEQLLAESMKSPPLAIIVDIRSQVAIGPESVKTIFELNTTWPVMRCNIRPDGTATVMCLEPHRTEELLSALEGISAGHEDWVPEGKFRNFLRLSLQLRVLIRREGHDWARANTLNVSVRGAFLATYDHHEKEERVELELRDLVDKTMRLEGIVKWVRRWEDTSELPGIGVAFESAGDIQYLADEVAKRFIQVPWK